MLLLMRVGCGMEAGMERGCGGRGKGELGDVLDDLSTRLLKFVAGKKVSFCRRGNLTEFS